MLITWLLVLGVQESARVNNVLVVVKLLVLAIFVIVGAQHINTENYKPFAPNGLRGIWQGAAIVFFAYIGFDAISTAAEETKNPQRNMPRGILLGLADLHGDLRDRRCRGDRPCSVPRAAGERSALGGVHQSRPRPLVLDHLVRRRGLHDGGPAGVPVRAAADFHGDGA